MELINGDCLEKLKDISGNSVDLVICDLPYGQTDCLWDRKIDLDKLWIELKRVSKINTPYFFFTTTKFGYELIKSNEKWFRYDFVWYKPNSSAGFLLSGKMPLRNFEMIYVFYNKLPFYNLNDNHTFEELTTKKNNKNGTLYKTKVNYGFKRIWSPPLPTALLTFPITNKRKNRLHSTEKPVELLKWIIKYYSKEGDLVLDPTMGSGSTGIACKALQRKFIGIELNNEIFELAKERVLD